MKRPITILGLLCFLLCLIKASAAITGTNAFDLQSVASTTANGLTQLVSSVSVPTRTFLIQHQGISGQTSSNSTGTNSLRVAVQLSFDGNNWTTLTNYYPARTNATVDSFTPNFTAVNAYLRVQVVTTNTISVGVTAVRP